MPRLAVNKYIVADPTICHGKPTFKGTRVMVWQILELLATGTELDEILKAFPSLKPEHIRGALDYASTLTRENYVIVNTAAPVSAR